MIRGASALAVATALGFLVWLGWAGMGTRDDMRVAAQQAVRVAELRGTFAYLDEWLTMSAHMAAQSGEPRWVARFDEAGPQLTAAIAEAVALATPTVSAALAATTDEASNGLIQMERASFAQAAAGDRDGAKALLDSPEFAYLKAVYASGIEVFGQDLETLATARAKMLNDRAWMETAGLVLSAVFLVAAAIVARGHVQLRQALACTEAVARTDALTDLPNRRRLYDELQAMLMRTERSGSGTALLLLDLDRFKLVNDVHGHPAGDQLLQLVAARLRAVARTGDLIARLGSDEFALVAPLDAPGQHCLPSEAAAQIARRVVAAFEAPFELDSRTVVQIGISIGLALAQLEGESADTLVRRADVALYRAKADGHGRFCFFEPCMDVHIHARASLEGELRQAIAADCIVPHFQPLVEMGTGRLIGFEMLARWPHPARGMVSPAEFVPIAEETGLIGPMTDRLLRRACCIAMAWPPDILLACNVSPLQLRDRDLPAMVRAALGESGLPPHRLELEITESALVGDLDLARDLLNELKALGVRLALDDFGTGYSSLRHLNMLPFDKLKIDAGFVGAMVGNVESRKIVAAVVGLGHSLGLITVAEGVEEPETATLLRDLGCDIGQGWLFGRPVSAEAIGALLQQPSGACDALQDECRL
jgi:diguanylate cyclase (GGDEF)-like protein